MDENKFETNDNPPELEENFDQKLFFAFEDYWQEGMRLWEFFQKSLEDDYLGRKWNDLTSLQQNDIQAELEFISEKFEKYRIADNSKKSCQALYLSSGGVIVGSLGTLAAVGIPCAVASAGGYHYNAVRKDKCRREIVTYYHRCQEKSKKNSAVGKWVCPFIRVFAEGASWSISEQLNELHSFKKLVSAEFV